MEDQQQSGAKEPDTGLRRILTYTFIALVFAALLSLLAVDLVIRWFGSG